MLSLAEKINSRRLPDFKRLTILIFDRDSKEIIKRHTEKSEDKYVQWSKKVYSIILPKDCSTAEKFSIEFLYERSEIGKMDKNKRKLFFSDEFEENGEHKENKELTLSKPNKYRGMVKVVEHRVECKNKKNHAISKNNFAKMVMNKKPPFDNLSFKRFEPLFDLVAEIYDTYKKQAIPEC